LSGTLRDARRVLNTLEAIFKHAEHQSPIPVPSVRTSYGRSSRSRSRVRQGGDSIFNLISALHKAVRGSDADGALFWLARMLAGGEDPLYIGRRLVRMAIEDIGLADPRALSVALAAKDAYHFLAAPKGNLV